MTSAIKEALITTQRDPIHQKYRPDIDGLRAIAVLAVVAFHAFPSKIKGGFVGVDVFFVISGFLISGIILSNLKNGSLSLLDFYSRRINRIFPALLLMLFTILAFSTIALFPIELEQLGKHIAGGTAFISNFILLKEVGYFDTSSDTKPLLHLWSLGVEEQFYLIWPLLLIACWRFKAKAIIAITIVGITSFALNAYYVSKNPSLDFYAPHTRFWELLFGAALAYFTANQKPAYAPDTEIKIKFRNTLSFIGLFLILISVKVMTKKYMFPGLWALIPVIGASLIIYAGPDAWINKNLLSSRPMVAVGLISFPLYLWHWPILALAREMNGDTPSPGLRWLLVALSLVLAWLTYKLIELPLRRNKRKKSQTTVLVILMLLVGMVGYVTWKSGGLPDRSNVKPYENVFTQFVGPLWKYTKNEYCLNNYEQPKDLKSYQWYFCYSSKERSPDILLFGNSYANHLLPGLAHNESTKENSILSIGTCSPDLSPKDAPTSGTSPCTENRIKEQLDIIENIVKKSSTVKTVIMAGLTQKTNPSLIKTAKEKIDLFESTGATVIIFTPHVKINYDIKSCYGRPLISQKNDCKIEASQLQENQQQFQPFIDEISKSNPRVKFFNINSLFCTQTECSFIRNGIPLLRDDSSHLSEFGSEELSKIFVGWAKTNSPSILTAQ